MEIENVDVKQVLDTRGLTCPMPLLKTKKTLKGLAPGDVLEIWGTDPGSKNDIPDFGNKNGNRFLGFTDDPEGFTRYFIRKG